MKKIFILIQILSTYFISVHGQDSLESKGQPEFRKILIGFNLSIDYCYRTLKQNDSSLLIRYSKAYRDTAEIPKAGFTMGLNICFSLTNQVRFETGIQYSNKAFQTKWYNVYFPPGGSVTYQHIYTFHYLELPLNVDFSSGNEETSLCFSAGIIMSLLLKATDLEDSYYGIDNKEFKYWLSDYTYNKINIAPTIAAGVDFRLGSRMRLKVEPTLKYGLINVIKSPVGIKEYLWSGGLNLSYSFGF